MANGKQGDLHPDDIRSRERMRAGTDLYAIQVMGRDELLGLQSALGYGDTWGVWDVRSAWVPKGSISTRQVLYADGSDKDERVGTEVLRVCLLLTLSLSGSGVELQPSTVVNYGKLLIRLSERCGEIAGPSTGWWSRLRYGDVVEILKTGAGKVLNNLSRLHARGLLSDEPIAPIADNAPLERDRYGETLEEFPEHNSRTWQPLPDRYTAECGRRVLWIVKHLGESLLDCMDECCDVEMRPGHIPLKFRTKKGQKAAISLFRNEVIRTWTWRDGQGKPIESLPFDLHFLTRIRVGGSSTENSIPDQWNAFAWPPRRWNELQTLVALLQSCHLWLLLLASGPRASTVLSYTIRCLLDTPAGPQLPNRLQGQLYKSTRQLGGRTRDWPLPPIIVRATKQQIRLATIARRLGNPDDPTSLGEDLWVSIHRCRVGSPKLHMRRELDDMADVFDLRHLLDADYPRVHPHRFRKTLARLIALAISSSQLVLMDTFGHEDPDQTLGYILSDRTIAADVQRVQRELVILMAVDAIDNADKLAGLKGVEIREQTYRFLRVKGKSKLDPHDVYELADQITLGGRTFRQVAPGLICTIPFLDFAPCGKGKGVRYDASNCQSYCRHRLVMPYRLMFVDDQIASMLPQMQRALDEDNTMMVAAWVSQVQNYLYEAPVIYQKWRDHPLIRSHCGSDKQPYFAEELPS